MKELTENPQENPDPCKSAADILFTYLRNIIYNPQNASLDIGQLPKAFEDFGRGLQFFCSLVAETRAFAKALSVGNLNCAPPRPRNEIAASMKDLHAALKHLTWQAQQVATGDYKQRVVFMGDFSDAFNNMIEQLEQRRKAHLDEKARLERHMNLLLANNPNPILLFDRQGRLTYASNAYLRHCGISEIDQVLGKHVNELLAPYVSEANLNEIEHLFAMAMRTQLTAEIENDISFYNNGCDQHFKVQIAPMLDMHNRTEGLLVFLIDVTASIQAYREAKRAREIAEQSAYAKSAFLARMSHEIRTPMNAIIGMSELALRENMPLAVREHILTMKQAGVDLLSIINNILDFSKIETGKLEIVPGNYLFSSLINDVISIIRMRVISKRIRLAVHIDCNMPNALFGDEMRIRQVLLNILSNAVKYTEKGFVSFTVTGEIIDENTVHLTMEVIDSGRGIKQADMKYLFSEFSRFDSTNNRGIEGTGLGLAITRNIIKAMGGDINVYSEYKKGSIFTVVLPQKYSARDKLASVENPEEKSVLIYEPRVLYTNSIACTLDNLGVYCEIAVTDAQFYGKMAAKAFPFIFISSALFETNKDSIAKLGANAKIILLTGFGETVAERQCGVLTMPAQSISIANILNNISDRFNYNENNDPIVRFTAPDARILIVDDISTNLKVAEGLLMPYKMQIDVCRSGSEAINNIQSINYDLVLMDHMMPGIDGIETVSRIRALSDEDAYYGSLPIIALTANAISSAKDMFLESGFNDFLSKPIDTVELDAVLARWIVREKQLKILGENSMHAVASAPRADQRLEIAGVDVRQGIAMSGGTTKNYLQTLAAFHKDWLENIEKIKMCLETDNLPLYIIYTHALKSLALGIGAGELSALAGALEAAGKQGDWAYITTRNPELLAALEALLNNLGDAVSADHRTQEWKDAAGMATLKAELAGLKAALATFDSGAIDKAVSGLQRFVQTPDCGAVVENLLHNILIGEYDEATVLIENLLQEGH